MFCGTVIFILMGSTKKDFITVFRHCYLVLTRMMGGREYSQVYTSILLSFKYGIMVSWYDFVL
jgi:hypothetical protein